MPPLTPIDPVDLHLRELGVKDGGSPIDSLEVDTSTTRRMFRCAWDKRFDAAKFFLGYAATYESSGTQLSRLVPQTHPDPARSHMQASKILSIRGHKWLEDAQVDEDGRPINVFEDADIEVLYEHLPYDTLDDDATETLGAGEIARYVEYPFGDSQGGGDYVQMPGACMNFIKEDNTKLSVVPFNSGKIIPQETFQVCWHRLPQNVWTPESLLFRRVYEGRVADAGVHGDTAIPMFGCINDAEFFGRPIGTVLFQNVFPKRRKSPAIGEYEWDLIFEFVYKPSGWNWLYFFDVVTPPVVDRSGWYFVGKGTTHYFSDEVPDDYSIYNARDLNKLFELN